MQLCMVVSFPRQPLIAVAYEAPLGAGMYLGKRVIAEKWDMGILYYG